MPRPQPVPKDSLLREIRDYKRRIAHARLMRRRRASTKPHRCRGTKASEELGRLLLTLAERLSQHPSWKGYSWREDLVAAALPQLIHACAVYDTRRGTSPFAYLTQTCWRCFVKETARQKSHGMKGLELKQFPEVAHYPNAVDFENIVYGAQDARFSMEG